MAVVKQYWIYLLRFWEVLVISSQHLTGPNVCRYKSKPTIKFFCCNDHYQKGNVCVECEPGFYGLNCSRSCPVNYFGRLCQNKCECSLDKFCDNVRGCMCKDNSMNYTELVGSSYRRNTEKENTFTNVVLSLLIIITLIAMFTVLGRQWYKDVVERKIGNYIILDMH
ncbi:uncharacterized protein LOC111108032 [Crassostrea virginica]